jgi:hypothetical protein
MLLTSNQEQAQELLSGEKFPLTPNQVKLKMYALDKENPWQKSLAELRQLFYHLCQTRHCNFKNHAMFKLVELDKLESVDDYARLLLRLNKTVVIKPQKAWDKNGAVWIEELLAPRIHVCHWSNPKLDPHLENGAYPRHIHTVSLGFDTKDDAMLSSNWLVEHGQCTALGLRIGDDEGRRTSSPVELKVWGMSEPMLEALVKKNLEALNRIEQGAQAQ